MSKLDNPSESPLVTFVPLNECAALSPWPDRVTGREAWSREVRDRAKVNIEYDAGWYRKLLELWDQFSVEQDPDGTNPCTVMKYFYHAAKFAVKEVETNKHVYGSTASNWLLSAGSQFMQGDFTLASMMHSLSIVRLADPVIVGDGIDTVIEPGCGTGINLFSFLYHLTGLKRVIGGEVSSNAVELGNRICNRYRLPGTFKEFDYAVPSSLSSLTEGFDNFALVTCHSLEQVQLRENRFIDSILKLPNPPRKVLHFEPVLWDDGSLMSQMCKRYATLNHYNTDLLDVLRKYEADGRIEILDVRKRYFGLSAFNPSSFICWRPR